MSARLDHSQFLSAPEFAELAGRVPVHQGDAVRGTPGLPAPERLAPVCRRVLGIVAGAYGLALGDLLGRSRERRCAWPRQICYYLLRSVCGMRTNEIAAWLHRTHGAVSKGIDQVGFLIQHDARERRTVDGLADRLREVQ